MLTRQITPSTACWTLVCMLSCAGTALSQSDTIYQVNGVNLRGKIITMTKNDITIKANGTPRKVELPNIDRILLSDSPSKMRLAKKEMQQQQYQQSLERLKEIKLDAGARKVLLQEYQFIEAFSTAQLALQGNGNPSEAAKKMVDFLRTNKNSFHYYDALGAVGDLAVAMGRSESASTYYGRMSQAPFPEYQARGTSLEAKALQTAGKPDAALKKYEDVLKLKADSPESRRQQTLARAGRASCLAELGQHAEALPQIKQIIEENDPQDQELFARTYNAMGACYRKSGQPMDATLAYMRTHLLFSSNSDSHAEALYHLTTLWPQINKPEKGAQMRKILKSRYAGTAWAQKE